MSVKSKTTFKRVALAAIIGFAAVAGCMQSTARAADDEPESWEDKMPDVRILRGILSGLGLRQDGAGIDYRERSPLVLPRSKELPPPEKDNPAKAANWPDDPDVKRAKQAKEAKRKARAKIDGEEDLPLRPSQLNPNGMPSGIRPDGTSGDSIEKASAPSTRADLGAKDLWNKVWAPKEEVQVFTKEPPRTSLIEPPAGYRTPSPNQPFGIGQEKWKYTVIDRQEPAK